MLFIRTTNIAYRDENGRGPLGKVVFKDPRGAIRTLLDKVTVDEAKEACPLLKVYDFATRKHPSRILDEIYEKYDTAKTDEF